MPLYVPTTDAPDLYVGSVPVSRMFFGDNYVWPPFEPVTASYTVPGDYVYQIPEDCWCIDEILVGAGGGGRGGGLAVGGAGGQGGVWKWRKLVRGVDIPWSQTTISVKVGAGGSSGSGGLSPNNGGSGGATIGTQTAPGGAGGYDGWSTQAGGAATGGNTSSGRDVTFNGILYVGGGATSVNSIGTGPNGNAPGGGAAGGGVPSRNGGVGASGAAYYRAYT
ncbi:hypothetical protein CUCO_5 [Mycobacterium phage Cuco]|uniref:Glycine-rich domain-containing protein n=1 Tax=Mycobacterium phage Cuco TaxID=2922992 RepID=G1JUI1_9CAUD|nr:minor tail protein [Mycobacterium phage Cuco]AEL17656.1 hypothetical protein CUCO_5 [Mycobacterium phage Cuco]